MKIKTISRKEEDYTRKTSKDIYRIQRNYAPEAHPFEKAREYTRALNATKLDRVFAKPFVGALDGHKDGVFSMAKHPTQLQTILSGSCDGEVKIWNLGTMKNTWSTQAHKGYVRGLSISPYGDYYLSCSDDMTVKKWNLNDALNKDYNLKKSLMFDEDADFDKNNNRVNKLVEQAVPDHTWIGNTAFTSVDHHKRKHNFATGGSVCQVWDEHRSEPMNTLEWDAGIETVTNVKFNPVEVDVLASCGSDRSVVLHDLRMSTPLKKLVLSMRTNQICWNPMEAFNFTCANEDSNLYTFDMRKMQRALNVHKDHVSAVLAVDYSPTGREFCSGAYDRTVRIFEYNKGHSREVYHTKRMQRIFSVLYTMDAKFVLSGSDETNVRVWKANASEKMGTVKPREKAALDYNNRLKERFQHHPEIKRIARHRHVPKSIMKAKETRRIMVDSEKRKTENRRKHSKPGAVPYEAERKKSIIAIKK